MAVTTSSASNDPLGEATLTLTYPSGAAGDTLLVWLSVDSAASPTVSGDLDAGELLSTTASTGRLRVYKRTRQSGDTDVTWTVSGTARMLAIAANVTPDLDTADPTTTLIASSTATVTPSTAPDGPSLLAVWFSFSDLLNMPTLLEWPDQDGDVTVGFELRLYEMSVIPTGISEGPPSHPTLDLFIRAVSYTTMPGGSRWTVGSVGWS